MVQSVVALCNIENMMGAWGRWCNGSGTDYADAHANIVGMMM